MGLSAKERVRPIALAGSSLSARHQSDEMTTAKDSRSRRSSSGSRKWLKNLLLGLPRLGDRPPHESRGDSVSPEIGHHTMAGPRLQSAWYRHPAPLAIASKNERLNSIFHG